MQVKEFGFGYAICEGMGISRQVDTLLVGEQPVGTWLLIFLQSAREVLTPGDAEKITNAVQAVDMVMKTDEKLSSSGLDNQSIEALFADLIDREPEKPESLIAFEQNQRKNTGE